MTAKRSRKNEHAAMRRKWHKSGVYDELFWVQDGKCALSVCRAAPTDRKLDIDHDHKTMRPRGLLCRRDNMRLAYWMTPEWLRSAADYLEDSGECRWPDEREV